MTEAPRTPLGEDRLHVPPGHHYSPIPATHDVERARLRATSTGRSLPGIDLREAEQLALLTSLQAWYDELDLPVDPGPGRFHYANTWFTYADAIAYALLLRLLRPQRVIEVGAGYSSALALDVADRFLTECPTFTFVDPDPDRIELLLSREDRAGRVLPTPVQDVPLATFGTLAANDILFIDSSHVLKAGSDVQFLFDEVLPRLRPGVAIHIHDVFWPFEYPEDWLMRGTALNEAYAVRALLTGGDRFRVLLFHPFLTHFHRDWFRSHMPLFLAGDYPTGGIWLTRQ